MIRWFRQAFCVDGVFAITMTLLVLELRPPDQGVDQLSKGLLAMLPRLYISFIAFYSIASHWIVHQRMFRHITNANTSMLWLMMLGLLFIILIPASTAIVGRFPGAQLAVASFSANSFFQALTNWIFWVYVVKQYKDFASQSAPRVLAITSQVWFTISGGWFISIFLGYLNVCVAYASWILLPHLAAVWENDKRRSLQITILKESVMHDKKKNKK